MYIPFGVSALSLSGIFLFDFGTVPTVRYFFFPFIICLLQIPCSINETRLNDVMNVLAGTNQARQIVG